MVYGNNPKARIFGWGSKCSGRTFQCSVGQSAHAPDCSSEWSEHAMTYLFSQIFPWWIRWSSREFASARFERGALEFYKNKYWFFTGWSCVLADDLWEHRLQRLSVGCSMPMGVLSDGPVLYCLLHGNGDKQCSSFVLGVLGWCELSCGWCLPCMCRGSRDVWVRC
jgi:hypothetical protein